jgi:hypothetical protein
MTIDLRAGIGCCSVVVREASRIGMFLVDLAKRFG